MEAIRVMSEPRFKPNTKSEPSLSLIPTPPERKLVKKRINPGEEGVVRVMSEPRFKPNTKSEPSLSLIPTPRKNSAKLMMAAAVVRAVRASVMLDHKAPVEVKHKAPVKLKHKAPVEVKHKAPVEVKHKAPVKVKHKAPVEVKHKAPVEVKHKAPVEVKHKEPVKVNDKASMKTIGSSTNQRHQHDAALLPIVNMDTHIRTSSPQPMALSDGGQIVQLESKEQKSLVDFDATTNQAYQSSVLVSSEKKNTIEANKGWWDSLIQRTEKDMREGLNEECLTKCALSLDDSTEQNSVDPRQGRSPLHSVEHEQQAMFKELGMDPENEGIVSDLLRFVREKELYKRVGKAWKRGYLLYDPPCTDRSSLMAYMAKRLEFKIYNLDLTGLSSIEELTNVLVSIRNRSLIAIKDFDHWVGMLPNLKNELTLSGLLEIIHGLLSSCGDERIIILTSNHNHIDRVDAALLHPLNIDLYIHTSSPQPIAVLDGGEIVQLDSSERKSLEGFDATNNRAYKSDVHMSNSEEKSTREASRRQCMPEQVLSLVDSMTRISSTDSDAPNNSTHLVRAYQSGPIVFNSEKKDSGEGLNRECLTKSVLSLDDSSRQKSLPDVDATTNKAHLLRAYQKGLVVSLSENKNRAEALQRECITKSMLGLEDLQQHFGGRRNDAAKNFPAIYDPDIHRTDSLAGKSFKVVETLPSREQPNDCVPLLSIGRLTLEGWLQEEKSPNLPRVLQINVVEQQQEVTKIPICLEGLTAEAALGLPDGGHIPSLPEKKIVRKTLKRKSRTMSVLSLEDHQQHVGRRWEDDAKFLGAKRICRQLAIDRKPTEKRILRQHGTRRCQSKQSAIDLPDGGHILSLSKKKIVRKTLKRKCRNMSVLRSEYHQYVDSKWDDAVKSLGGAHAAKHIYRQLVIHRVSRAKCICRQHGFHRWPFQQNWATLKGYFLGDERPVAVISLSIDGKLVSRLQLIHISWLGRFSPLPPALPPGGEIVGPPLALSSSQLPSTSNRAQLGGQDRSGSTAAHSQNERTRDQTEGSKRKIKHFTIEKLRSVCRLNRQDAAKELGVSVSTLKRRRQELGIMRWPPPEEVFRPPDGNGENNPPSTSNMLSANGQITMEIGMGGPNSEPNERQPNSFEDPNFQNKENGSIAEFENPATFYDSHHGHDPDANFLFLDVFNRTEAAGGSGHLWEQGFESSDPMFLVYPDAAAPSQSALTIPPTMPPPQIASTQIPRENMREDRRSFLAPQEEPLPEGHVFGSVNCTIGSISDLAPSQDMPTAADTMVGHRVENNHYGSSNLIDASCSNLASSQTMQPTISHMTPLLTQRQDSRFVKLDAACDEDLINLYLPLMPGIMDLKQAVSVQLGLGLDRFKVKYKDGRGKWILMTHDEDVRELRRLTSLENQDSNRLEVIKVSNTTCFCRNCQCRIT